MELEGATDGEFIIHDIEDGFAALTMKYKDVFVIRRIVRANGIKWFLHMIFLILLLGQQRLEGCALSFPSIVALVGYFSSPDQVGLPRPLVIAGNL